MLQDGLHKNVLKAKGLERLLWHICIKHNNYHVEVRPDFDPSCQIPNYDISIMSSREENSWIKRMRFKYKHFIFMSLKLKIQQDEQEGCLTQKFNTVTLANYITSLWKCPAKNNYFDHNYFFFFGSSVLYSSLSSCNFRFLRGMSSMSPHNKYVSILLPWF